MRELLNVKKRVGKRCRSLENAKSELFEVEDAYRSGNDVADKCDVDVSTTTGLGEIRITVHWHIDHALPSRLSEQLHNDVWDTATLYRNGGHAKSEPDKYEYHLVAETTIEVD